MQLRKIGGLWFLNVGRYTFMFCRRKVTRHPSWFSNWVAEHERLHDVMAGAVRERAARERMPVVIEHE